MVPNPNNKVINDTRHYLLDTNLVAVLRNKPTTVRDRLRKAQADGEGVVLSSVVLIELWYGAAKSSCPASGEGPGKVHNPYHDDIRG
ncbi:MAG: hypothetical protein U0Q15_10280 [Kineosporiaceae bacterium]